MQQHEDTRTVAVERLQTARDERARCSSEHEAARGSAQELPASAHLREAEDQLAAREAWVKWIDGDR